MRPTASSHVRLARPSADLDRSERFWVDGLGLEVLYRASPEAEGDLLVLYLGGPADDDVIDRLERAGGRRVPARNPYWDRWGITIEDPDGYRLLLCSREWTASKALPRG
jgi:catechol 2,3-dioxygenase-like lactoylglutathione lyase family enzyme